MRSTAVPVVLALATTLLTACGDRDRDPFIPDDTDSGTTDSGGDTDATTPATWHVTGQTGQIFAVNSVRAGSLIFPSYGVHMAFADTLQGLATAPWCQAGGPCLPELPPVGSHTDGVGVGLDPMGSQWTWNGHEIGVGALDVPFTYDDSTGLAWYSRSIKNMPDSSPVSLSFEGEWGRFNGEIVVPDALDITSPDPDKAVPIDDIVPFRWTPTGANDVYLRVATPELERLYHLDDDGSFDFDPGELDLGGATDVSLSLGRWNVQTHDVNGNELSVVGVWEQPFAPLICEDADYPSGNIGASGTPLTPFIEPASVVVSFVGVIDSPGVHDFLADRNEDGTNELYSAALAYTFYDAVGVELCSVYYDANSATPVPTAPTPVSGGGVIYEAWDIVLNGGDSDCRAIDPNVWGVRDVRDVLNSVPWGFGIGTISETSTALSEAYGGDWATWEPLLAGAYIKIDADWYEVGGVASVAMAECGVVDNQFLAMPKPKGAPLPTRYYEWVPVVSFGL